MSTELFTRATRSRKADIYYEMDDGNYTMVFTGEP